MASGTEKSGPPGRTMVPVNLAAGIAAPRGSAVAEHPVGQAVDHDLADRRGRPALGQAGNAAPELCPCCRIPTTNPSASNPSADRPGPRGHAGGEAEPPGRPQQAAGRDVEGRQRAAGPDQRHGALGRRLLDVVAGGDGEPGEDRAVGGREALAPRRRPGGRSARRRRAAGSPRRRRRAGRGSSGDRRRSRRAAGAGRRRPRRSAAGPRPGAEPTSAPRSSHVPGGRSATGCCCRSGRASPPRWEPARTIWSVESRVASSRKSTLRVQARTPVPASSATASSHRSSVANTATATPLVAVSPHSRALARV